MDGTILHFDNLTLGYDRHPAVHHLDYAIRGGALVAVVGPNGAGKSTLLKGIVGSLAPLGGGIRLAGIDASEIAYLPQQADIDRSFPISVFDMVAMGLWRKTEAFLFDDQKLNLSAFLQAITQKILYAGEAYVKHQCS